MANDQIQARACETINSDMPDAAILQAWKRRKAAYERIYTLDGAQSPEYHDHMETVDAAEAVIQATIATTLQGVAAQVWTGLWHAMGVNSPAASMAATRGDLQHFLALGSRLEWGARLDAETNVVSINENRDSPFDASGAVKSAITSQTDMQQSQLSAVNENLGRVLSTLNQIAANGSVSTSAAARIAFSNSF